MRRSGDGGGAEVSDTICAGYLTHPWVSSMISRTFSSGRGPFSEATLLLSERNGKR